MFNEQEPKPHFQQQTVLQPGLRAGIKENNDDKETNTFISDRTKELKVGDNRDGKKVMKMGDHEEDKKLMKMGDHEEDKKLMKMGDHEEDKKLMKMGDHEEDKKLMKMGDHEEDKKVMRMGDIPSNAGAVVPQHIENQIQNSKGSGQSLPASIKKDFSKKIGADLSGVKIHTDSQANEMNKDMNAKAFTYGQDIYFKEGNYNLNSNEGKELLAHEVVHTLQQNKNIKNKIQKQSDDPPKVTGTEKQGDISPSGKYVFLEGGDGNKRQGIHGKWILKPEKSEIDEAYLKVLNMSAEAKKQGATQAAKNLDYWLSGKGGTYNPFFAWLFSVPVYNEAQKQNTDRFFNTPNSKGETLNIIANRLKEGETSVFNDYWEAVVWSSALHFPGDAVTPDLDFAFAYGTAKLVSTGSFSLVRKGDKVTVTGKISHNFIDRYDWELGMTVLIGGETVSDQDMKVMEIYKGAKPFDVNCTSTESINRTIDV